MINIFDIPLENICKCLTLKDISHLEQTCKLSKTMLSDIYKFRKYNNNGNFIIPNNYDESLELYNYIHKLPDKNLIKEGYRYISKYYLHKYETDKIKTKGLTEEQMKIINYKPSKKELITIQAFAGTGKTTTCINFAKKNADLKVLFLAFNKFLSNDKQIPNITFSTIHSLAYDKIGKNYEIEELSYRKLMSLMNLQYDDSNIIIKVLNNFWASNHHYINHSHIQQFNLNSGTENTFLNIATNIWNMILNKDIPITHDGYLKLFDLQKCKIEYDVIILDEVQDITNCILQIILRQSNPVKILVGDINQQIYNFRNVCDPFLALSFMNKTDFYLTNTFRFGSSLTFFVNNYLSDFLSVNNNAKMMSFSSNDTKILPYNYDIDEPYTLLTRSNINVIREALELEKKVYLVNTKLNCDKEIQIIYGLIELDNHIESSYPKLSQFSSIEEALITFKRNGKYKWCNRINIFRNYDPTILISKYTHLKSRLCDNKEDAEVIISTVHQTKGLEFDVVKLSDDFISLTNSITDKITKYKTNSSNESYRILYVALTRAKLKLILNRQCTYYLRLKQGKKYDWIKTNIIKNCEKCCNYNQIIQTSISEFGLPTIKNDLCIQCSCLEQA